MYIVLQRLTTSSEGTFGTLLVNGRPYYVTLELPWKNNQKDISCIPPGEYKATRMFSEKFKKVLFVLHNVPGRDLIEFHIGNKVENTNGCILLGSEFSKTEYAIVDSKVSFDDFMIRMPAEGFTVLIKDVVVGTEVTWI
jgi:Family of unknown function (DUF5675)